MSDGTTIRAAAIQMEAEVGNVDANLEMAAALVDEAAAAGASWIVLPEFFSTGVANRPELRDAAPLADGAPTALLRERAARHGVHLGGSTLVRDRDGHVRNAFLLAGPDGELRGRHDKDLPTMWENALYVGGGDPGRIEADGLTAGVALCWELMRTQTAARLAGRVDLVVGGSGWWSIPLWPPRGLSGRLERANHRRAVDAPARFAPYVGAPVVHAAHAGALNCPWPLVGAVYHGHYAGGAGIYDTDGRPLALRRRDEGPGVAIADVVPGRREPRPLPEGFWLQPRGAVAAAAWAYQNPWGRSRYWREHRRRLDRAALAGAAS
ncbi:carbon-nitrogen hydrolase family protein [Patulibacter defluvii]|uniref:carbon-nitrogen hydrolase family protein n=1 Tax=Patulibacter defluvii TaxID=3095358 RepID=UPI0035C8FEA2